MWYLIMTVLKNSDTYIGDRLMDRLIDTNVCGGEREIESKKKVDQ